MLWQSYHRKLIALAETAETLTNSQQKAGYALRQEVSDYQQRINLWGAAGVGKTFLAHYLHHRAEGLYFPSASDCQSTEVSPNSVVIIDNAPHDRSSARSIFGDTLWAGASSVILVTRQPIDDAVRRVELVLADQDLAHIDTLIRTQFGERLLDDRCHAERLHSGIWERIKPVGE